MPLCLRAFFYHPIIPHTVPYGTLQRLGKKELGEFKETAADIPGGPLFLAAFSLVGDAAFCPSLLAGQGSALAMIGAYVLAGELGQASLYLTP